MTRTLFSPIAFTVNKFANFQKKYYIPFNWFEVIQGKMQDFTLQKVVLEVIQGQKYPP